MPIKDPFEDSGIVDPFQRGNGSPVEAPLPASEPQGVAAPTMGRGEALWRGVKQGGSFNFADEMAGLRQASGVSDESLGGTRLSPVGVAVRELGLPLVGAARLGIDYLRGSDDSSKRYSEAVEKERALNQQAEKERGGWYMGGQLVGAGALPVGASLQAATLPARLARGATIGGLTGAGMGAGEGEDLADRASRAAVGAGVGAVVGTVAPAAIEGAKALGSLAKPTINALRGLQDPEAEAARRVVTGLKRDYQIGGPGLSAAEFEAAQRAGVPVAVADLGGTTTRALARSAANTSTEAREVLERLTNDRFESQGERAADFVRGLIRTPGNKTETLDAIEAAMRQQRSPFYQRAYREGANGILDNDLKRMYDTSPAMQNAFQDAISSIQNKVASGRAMEPLSPQTGLPTLEFWDQVQRSLRSKAEVLRRGGDKEAAADVTALRSRLIDKLDTAAPTYPIARGVAAQLFKAGDAVEAGSMFVTKGRPEDVRKIMTKMTPEERTLFAEGFVSEYIDQINKMGNRRSILGKLGASTDARKRLTLALGEKRAQELDNFLRVERTMDFLRGAVSGNSTTARQLIEAGMAGTASGLWSGDPQKGASVAGMWFLMRHGGTMLNQRIDQKVAMRVGQMLASDDPNVLRKGLKFLQNNPKYARAMEAGEKQIAKLGGIETPKGFISLAPQAGSKAAADENQTPGRAEGGGIVDPFDNVWEQPTPPERGWGDTLSDLGEFAYKATPALLKPAVAPVLDPKTREAWGEGLNKSAGAMTRSYFEALNNEYIPEGAVSQLDSGEWLDQNGNVLHTQYRPNLLPITEALPGPKGAVGHNEKGEYVNARGDVLKEEPGQEGNGWFGSKFEGAMPAMADVWNTFAAPTKAASAVVAAAKAGSEGKLASAAAQAAREAPELRPGIDVYHGTKTPTFDKFQVGDKDSQFHSLDRALGVHVAPDPEIPNTFARVRNFDRGDWTPEGGVYPLRIPEDAKFLDVPQQRGGWDEQAVERMVAHHVYQRDPEMLADYLQQARAVKDPETAYRAAKDLAIGKTADWGEGPYTLDRLVDNFGGRPYNPADRKAMVEAFRQDMIDEGYSGLRYKNTSPEETTNAKDATSYIVFEPNKSLQNRLSGTFMAETGAEGKAASAVAQSLRPENAAFYSAAERAVEGAKQNKATPDQWLNWLRNQPGVTKDELEHLDLNTWANFGMGKPVTKDEFLQYMKSRDLGLKETVYGGKQLSDEEYDVLRQQLESAEDTLNNLRRKDVPETDPRWQSATEDFKRITQAMRQGDTPTRFEQYTMPGGENYRELVYTLPKKEVPLTQAQLDERVRSMSGGEKRWDELTPAEQNWVRVDQERINTTAQREGAFRHERHWPGVENPLYHLRVKDREIPLPLTAEQQEALRAREVALKKVESLEEQQRRVGDQISEIAKPLEQARRDGIIADFKEGRISWPEADKRLMEGADYDTVEYAPLKALQNQLQALRAEEDAIRASMPADPGNNALKTLHLEELQSDWHQTGKKQGYKGTPAEIPEPTQDAKGNWRIDFPDGRTTNNWDTREEAIQSAVRLIRPTGAEVPNAPFKKSWAELGLRNALLKAVQEGKDAISWTPGIEQAKHYNLAKQVDEIWALRDGDGKYMLTAKPKGRAQMIDLGEGNVPEDKLADYVGKELAEKIAKQGDEAQTYSGVDLHVGGEGMKAFYDKMLVNKANDIGKKFGAKVEWAPIEGSAKDIDNMDLVPRDGAWRLQNTDTNEFLGPAFRSGQDAEAWLQKNHVKSIQIPVMRITPKMREHIIQKGLPLFAETGAEGKSASAVAQQYRQQSAGDYFRKIDALDAMATDRATTEAEKQTARELKAKLEQKLKDEYPNATRESSDYKNAKTYTYDDLMKDPWVRWAADLDQYFQKEAKWKSDPKAAKAELQKRIQARDRASRAHISGNVETLDRLKRARQSVENFKRQYLPEQYQAEQAKRTASKEKGYARESARREAKQKVIDEANKGSLSYGAVKSQSGAIASKLKDVIGDMRASDKYGPWKYKSSDNFATWLGSLKAPDVRRVADALSDEDHAKLVNIIDKGAEQGRNKVFTRKQKDDLLKKLGSRGGFTALAETGAEGKTASVTAQAVRDSQEGRLPNLPVPDWDQPLEYIDQVTKAHKGRSKFWDKQSNDWMESEVGANSILPDELAGTRAGIVKAYGLTAKETDDLLTFMGVRPSLGSKFDDAADAQWKLDFKALQKSPGFLKTLKKLPEFKGTLWRGIDAPETVIKNLKQGAVFSLGKVVSASHRANIALDYVPSPEISKHYDTGKPVLFRIDNASGRVLPTEEETVLLPGTKYQVKQLLQESDPQPHTLAIVEPVPATTAATLKFPLFAESGSGEKAASLFAQEQREKQKRVPRPVDKEQDQDASPAQHRASGGRVVASNINHNPSEAQKEAGHLTPRKASPALTSGNPQIRKPSVNGLVTHAELFGDSSHAESLQVKGFDFLNRQGQHVVLSAVLRAINNPKVFRRIVQTVPIHVVNLFLGKKLSPQQLLHDPTVLAHRLTFSRDVTIPQAVGVFIDALSSALERTFTLRVAEEPQLPFSKGLRGPQDRSTAEGARNGSKSSHETVLVSGKSITLDSNPTEAQIKAGNYKKGSISCHGLDITIENAKGHKRRGEGPTGPWEVVMPAHYGYVKNSLGADGDHVDVYLGDHPKAKDVYVVDQLDAETGDFDEHKALMCFGSERQALQTYLRGFSDGKGKQRFGAMKRMPIEEFKEWVFSPKAKKPIAR